MNVKQGRTEEIISEIGELLDDARGTSLALSNLTGQPAVERLNQERAMCHLFDLINTATVHLVRQEAESYGPADKVAILIEIEGLRDRVELITGEQLPPAIEDLAKRTLRLVDTIVGKATSKSMAVAVAAMENSIKYAKDAVA